MTPNRQAGVTLIEVLIAVTLLSLLSVGMLFAMRVGLNAMGKTNQRIVDNRRAMGVERILTQQVAGLIPTKAGCGGLQGAPSFHSFFGGKPQTMQFVSTYSLQEASRGYPQMLEFQVIPGEEGRGVRLIVNETVYGGPFSTFSLCLGQAPAIPGGPPVALFRPVPIGETSFVLADKLAACTFFYKEKRPEPEPELWRPIWPHDYLPGAIRIDLAPVEPDISKIQLPSIVVPIRVDRHPLATYGN